MKYPILKIAAPIAIYVIEFTVECRLGFKSTINAKNLISPAPRNLEKINPTIRAITAYLY
jgi:hypothetical protein